jgi:hypothetical protein
MTLLTRIEVDVWLRRLQILIRDILTPLSGIVLLFYLVHTPGERPSYFIAAAGLIGLPVALKAQRRSPADEE